MADRSINVKITGNASDLEGAFARAGGAASSFGSKLASMGKMAAMAVGAAGIGGMALVLKVGTDEFMDSARAAAQTEAAIKSTGRAANLTAKQIGAMSTAMSLKTGIDDEAIQHGANMLLSFTKIRNETGKGNDVFTQANMALADMATRMANGATPNAEQLSKSAIRLGKALNDPLKGMTALQKVGVMFDAGQKAQITSMMKAGDIMGAQKLILKELNTEFGGSAVAAGNTLPGSINKMKNAFAELSGQIVGSMAPAMTAAMNGLAGFFGKIGAADGAKAKLKVLWDGISSGASDAASALGDAFSSINWDSVLSSVQNIGSKIGNALKNINWSGIGASLSGAISSIQGAFAKINWSSVLGSISSGVSSLAKGIGSMLGAIDWGGLSTGLMNALSGILNAIPGFVGQIEGAVSGLAVAVLGALNKVDWGSVAGTILKVIGTIPATLISAIQAIDWGAIGSQLSALVVNMLNGISSAMGKVNWNNVGAEAVKGIGVVIVAIGSFLGNVDWFAVLGAISRGIIAVLGAIGGILVGAAGAVGGKIVEGIGKGLGALAGVVGRELDKVPAFVGALPGRITGALGNIGGLLVSKGSQLIGGMMTGIANSSQNVLNFFLRLPGLVLTALGDLGSILVSAGSAILQGLWDGAKAKWEQFKNWLSGLGEKIRGLKGPLDVDLALLHPAGVAIMQGLQNGMEEGFGGVMQFATDAGGRITSGVTSGIQKGAPKTKAALLGFIQNLGTDAHRAIQQDVIKTIEGPWGAVITINGKVKMNIEPPGPAKAPPTVLGDIGTINTMTSTQQQTAETVAQYTAEYVDTSFATPGYSITMTAAQVYALPGNQTATAAATVGTGEPGTIIPYSDERGGGLRTYARGGKIPGVGPKLIIAHGGETVTPVGGGETVIKNYYFPNYVGDKHDLLNLIRTEDNRNSSRNAY